MKRILKGIVGFLIIVMIGVVAFKVLEFFRHDAILKQMIERLQADSRVAEVLVTKSEFDETNQTIKTTIKFLMHFLFQCRIVLIFCNIREVSKRTSRRRQGKYVLLAGKKHKRKMKLMYKMLLTWKSIIHGCNISVTT